MTESNEDHVPPAGEAGDAAADAAPAWQERDAWTALGGLEHAALL